MKKKIITLLVITLVVSIVQPKYFLESVRASAIEAPIYPTKDKFYDGTFILNGENGLNYIGYDAAYGQHTTYLHFTLTDLNESKKMENVNLVIPILPGYVSRSQSTIEPYINLYSSNMDGWQEAGTSLSDIPKYDEVNDFLGRQSISAVGGVSVRFDVTNMIKNQLGATDNQATFILTGPTVNDINVNNGTGIKQNIIMLDERESQSNGVPYLEYIYSPHSQPTGTVSINNGASLTNSTNVKLNIVASDPDNDRIEMSFSNDNTTWSSWESFSLMKDWSLSNGDGEKTVYMRLKDLTGEQSVIYDDEILLDTTFPFVTGVTNGGAYKHDITITFNEGAATLNGAQFTSGSTVSQEGNYTLVVTDDATNQTTVNFSIDKTPPQGSISILNGAGKTNTPLVTLNLTGVDANSLLMQFSNDGSTWSKEEIFTNNKTWMLTNGDGIKTVYYKLTDSAGNSAQYSDTIILNTTLNSNADLKSIAFSKGALTPTFTPNILSYTLSVASQVSSIDLYPIVEINKATLKVNGVDVISGNKKTIPLSYAANIIRIDVTAEDGRTKKTYTVTVNRAKPSNPESVNPIPVQPENPTPVKAIPNTMLPNPHGLPVATLTVNEDIKLYQLDDASNLVEAKLVRKGTSLLVYDIYKGYYKLADNLYAIPSPTISLHIGKGEVRKDEVNVYDKDGRFIRTIKKGQEYKVYSYDDNRYAIGGGEFIDVQDGVTYVFGWITLTERMPLYKPDGTVERTLNIGEKYRLYQADIDALHLGGGYTVKRDNSLYTFVKN
ncbi:cadherin-like beta sandwich domain-containing protein [Psychrobacillus vulpis]|uniref:Cadherin-like beta sandwich domain-containing protein n=1 Tax=Psychrobacillus vulpis TaxID=2325572 RepID=A0A544TUX2_9BACI|nr:cadherin-like beta sandwich domain-containing protein [Psychrobacillus vulpis]TQR21243.1 cadherin-like beta sandwich domain-containing protein [Psychrobacillus vulpis]